MATVWLPTESPRVLDITSEVPRISWEAHYFRAPEPSHKAIR